MRHRAPVGGLLLLFALAANAQRVNIAYFYNGDDPYHPRTSLPAARRHGSRT